MSKRCGETSETVPPPQAERRREDGDLDRISLARKNKDRLLRKARPFRVAQVPVAL